MDPLDTPHQPVPTNLSKSLLDSLRGSHEFELVFKHGVKIDHASVILRALRRSDDGVPRLGLIVPKKKTKLAVRRNAFKRVARDALTQALCLNPHMRGLDVVLQFKGLPQLSLRDFKLRASTDVKTSLSLALEQTAAASAKHRMGR